ncbi:helix-turn-helix domain-containing protein [Niastella caeni]|uniref:Helix-turn-helix domain-containing protein n=1 Tax=Niastella caeni TaxID=2569763 RepID=A0A4S8HKT8_9BACT|nr:AraC family transcriptional regulator [Niastella caeni]THU34969.1 helix-turn-helix domain-containing protein [Niastella caeni]
MKANAAMKATSAVYLYPLKDMNDYSDHSWNMEGLRVFLSRPEHKKDFIQYPFRSDSYWVALVLNGSLTIQLNGEEQVINENSMLIIPPHVVRQFDEAPNNTCNAACVAFTPDFMLDTGLSQRHIDLFEYLFNSHSTHLRLASEDASRFLTMITMLQEKNFSREHHPFATEVVRHFFNVFQFELAGLYHKHSNQKKAVHDHKEEIVWRFLGLLSKHVKSERNLLFYANRLYVTPKYLTQTVKKLTGKTAGKYIDELVIVEAKNLLRDPALTIAQVADLLYFSDQFFFSKFFKRYTGITPSVYRKSV